MDARALRHVFGFDRRSENVTTASKFHFDDAFKPFPTPTGEFPFRLDLEDVLGGEEVDRINQAGIMVFHTVGDTGNASHGADAQESVAFHLEEQLRVNNPDARPKFFYHLGDVVYFNGEKRKYEPQFYDPYMHYTAPIVAIAGNHDAQNVANEDSLEGFMANFCDSQPRHTAMAGQSNRTTMIQPNVFWTLATPLATIVGLYSNVPGKLDKQDHHQQDWLAHELKTAPGDRALIVTVHHPPYSLDDTHGGFQSIEQALDDAIAGTNRIPDLVLTGHVHNYQRFERTLPGRPRPLTLVVAGAGGFGGYTNLHQLKTLVHPNPAVHLRHNETRLPGFLRLSVTRQHIQGEYFVVPAPPDHLSENHPARRVDTFTINL
jgi:Icc-related predicted phosphoesterase